MHCLSEWGHDFRVSYLTLIRTIHRLTPRTKLLGLTATASVNVLQDLKAEFSHGREHFGDFNVKSQLDFSRKELGFEVERADNQQEELHERIEAGQFPTLVFAPHVNGAKGVFPIAKRLQAQLGASADWYAGSSPKYRFEEEHMTWHHLSNEARQAWLTQRVLELGFTSDERENISTDPADYTFKAGKVKAVKEVDILSPDALKAHKESVQARFIKDEFRVLVATKAFGMGIDKPNIHNTYHFGLPAGVEALYQEAGRAGRGNEFRRGDNPLVANCTVLYRPEEKDVAEQLLALLQKDGDVEAAREYIDELAFGVSADQITQLYLFFGGLMAHDDQVHAITELFAWKGPKSSEALTNETKPGAIWARYTSSKPGFSANRSEPGLTAVYRLGILGLVDDWTVDYGAGGIRGLKIYWRAPEAKAIREGLLHYLRRYDKVTDFAAELGDYEELSVTQVLAKAATYLVDWTARNITYNRLQALNTLVGYCNDFTDSDSFKAKLDSYFRISDRTVVLQHLIDHPFDVARWEEVFWDYDDLAEDKSKEARKSIFQLPERALRPALVDLRDGLRRFLEGFDNNPGLNLISGLTHLALEEYDLPDGRPRFRRALEAIRDNPGFGEIEDSRKQSRQVIVERLLTEIFDALPRQRYPAVQDALDLLNDLRVDYVDRYDLLELATDRIADRRRRLHGELDRMLSFRIQNNASPQRQTELEDRLARLDQERALLIAELNLSTPDVR